MLASDQMRFRVWMTRWLLSLALLGGALAAGRPAHADSGEELSVYVLTFGPGDHPFFKFGHNAIWVQPRAGRGLAFNFGTFQFDSPALIPKFLRGRLTYWLSVTPIEDALMSYEASNRTIEAQELDLPAARKLMLLDRLRENAKSQNREYLYDYFWDNCSTRVRDVLDGIVDGRLKAAGQSPASMTFRDHALRMTADLLPEYIGLHLGLGSLTDAPITRWDEAFLPERLRDLLRSARIASETGEKPLVKAERVLFQARRPLKPPHPPGWLGYFLGAGLLAGASLALLGVLARRHAAARVAFGATTSLFGLVLGLLGIILALLWMATNHKAAHANANILLCAPWAITLTVYGVHLAGGRRRSLRRAFWIAASAAIASAVGLMVKMLPGPAQDNYAFIALMLPLWVGLAFGLWHLGRARVQPGSR